MSQATFVQIAVWGTNLYALDKGGVIWKCVKQQDNICAWQPIDQEMNPEVLNHSQAVGDIPR